MVDERDFLTIAEAMAYTGYSRSTLDRFSDLDRDDPRHITKYIRGMRRRVYFKKSDIDNLMNELQDIRPEEQ